MCTETELIELSAANGDSVRCRIAHTFWSRFFGLMGKAQPSDGEGLLIRPCNSIHMFFMRFAIDAAFLDRELCIVRLIHNLAPGRVVGAVKGAWQVLEVPAGNLPSTFKEGIRLSERIV